MWICRLRWIRATRKPPRPRHRPDNWPIFLTTTFLMRTFVLSILLISIWPLLLRADRIILKDGFELSGSLSVDRSQITVRTELKTYFVSADQLIQPEAQDPVEPPETFALSQPILKSGRQLESVSRVVKSDPFDQFGRRTIYLEDNLKKPVPVHQAVTEIHPTHVVLEGINYVWRSAIAISDIPQAELLAILRQASDSKSLPAQLKLTTFLLQARMYSQARLIIEDMRKKFPESTSQIEPLAEQLHARLSADALRIAARAIELGQLAKARRIIDEFQSATVPPTDRLEWARLAQLHDMIQTDLQQARSLILDSLANISPNELPAPIDTVAREAATLVSPASIDRLRPLLVLADQPATTNHNRLALAVSGWILGNNLATSHMPDVEQFALRRDQLASAIATTDDDDFQRQVQSLVQSGAKSDWILQMIPLLPAPETERIPGEVAAVRSQTSPEVNYKILLPPDYDRTRGHPTIVALHGLHGTPDDQIEYWKSAASDAGMIVIAPEYLLGPDQTYEYSIEEHDRFLAVLADARKRFAVDSNRVFLSGHEIGGFAAFDIAMGHPDEFAGLVAISGVPMFYAQYYWRNVAHLPIYAVEGQRNGGNPAILRTRFDKFFREGHPAIYVEYAGRGSGRFPSERPRILDWLARKSRNPFPHEIEAASARLSDKRFYWVEADTFLPNATIAPKLFDKKKGLRPAKINASLSVANTLDIRSAGLQSLNILVSPQLLQTDDPNLTIRVNRKVIQEGPIDPDLTTLLDTLRHTGDKQRLVVKILRVEL